MATYSINNKNLFRIEEEITKDIFYGSNQDWYGSKWQRMSGCGPSTVANIVYYIYHAKISGPTDPVLTKEGILKLMDEVWNYVTPSLGGVSSTAMLCKGVEKYKNEKNITLTLGSIDIPKKVSQRPAPDKVTDFIRKALEKDSPVAFLNLERGEINVLDSWHWVTITSLDIDQDAGTVYVEILDSGEVKQINLLQWLQTTKLGGGFVSFL
jgi:hypothetical protein